MPPKASSPQETERRRRQLRLRAQLLARKSEVRTDAPTEMGFTASDKSPAEQRRADTGGIQAPTRRKEKVPDPSRDQMMPIDPESRQGRSRAATGERLTSGFTDSQHVGQAIIHGALAAGGTAGGGMAAEGLLSKRLGIPVARAVGEFFGAGGSAAARQQALDPGSKPDLRNISFEAALAGGSSLLTSGLSLGGADVGRIAPVFVDDIAQRTRTPAALFGKNRGFRSTFGELDPSLPSEVIAGKAAEISQGVSRVRKIMPAIRRKMSPERIKKQELLREHDHIRIPPDDMIAALEDSKIGTGDIGPLAKDFETFNSAIDFTIRGLRRAQVEGITPRQLDELIRKQLRQKAFGKTGEPSSTLLGEVFGDLNGIAQDMLEEALPGEVGALNRAISARMELMDRAEKMFGHGRSTEAGVTESQLANAFRANNSETAQMLNFIEEMAGATDKGLARDMFELAKERAFSGDVREASQASGFFQNVFGRLARGVTKTLSPIQSQVGPGIAGFRAGQEAFEAAMQQGHNEADRQFEIQRLQDEQRKMEIRKETDKSGF